MLLSPFPKSDPTRLVPRVPKGAATAAAAAPFDTGTLSRYFYFVDRRPAPKPFPFIHFYFLFCHALNPNHQTNSATLYLSADT
jgi:hypothetical protein